MAFIITKSLWAGTTKRLTVSANAAVWQCSTLQAGRHFHPCLMFTSEVDQQPQINSTLRLGLMGF